MAARQFLASSALRFSIRQLLLGTALVAVGCVALRGASPIWVSALLGCTLLALTAAVPLALFCQGSDRVWWFGFALFGWMYMLLLAYGWSLDPNTSANSPLRPQGLVTARLGNLGYDRIYGGAGATSLYQQVVTSTSYPVAYTNSTAVTIAANPYATATTNVPVTMSYIPVTNYTVTVAGPPPGIPALDDFLNVAHALWTIVIAVCGGWFTCWLDARRRATSAAPVPSARP